MTPHLKQPYHTAAQEDRCAPRARVSIFGTIKAANGECHRAEICDLSVAGFSAVTPVQLPAGTKCWLTLPGVLMLPAQVAWREDGVAGCAFDQLLDPALRDHLVNRAAY